MQDADLRLITKVLPGNKIEIEIPESKVGEDIEVIVMFPEKPKSRKRRALEILEAAHKLGPFRTTEEIDSAKRFIPMSCGHATRTGYHDLQVERDSWDS